MTVDKNHLLNESKVFCMFPWVHLNVTPKGDIYPCCSNNYTDPVGNTKVITLKEAFNSEKMKELRLNMLNDKPTKICDLCYKQEETSPHSFRKYSIEHFAKNFDELVPATNPNGSLDEFKMRYFDIRFSNICNFKCRTCGAEFSSQWAAENKINNPSHPILFHADDSKGQLLEEVLTHIDHIDLAYFAGGEPLITEEHYIILEELIRKGRTDVVLRYNTNASNIKFKQYDLLDLWKRFDRIEVSCSIDHYGDRAELLRHGTDWGKVEKNLLMFRDLDYVEFQMNTVFSIFNYQTITDFYSYMEEKGIVRKGDWHHTLYLAPYPPYYASKALPKSLKIEADRKIAEFIAAHPDNFKAINHSLNDASLFANAEHTWTEQKEKFLYMNDRLNGLRNEDLFRVFPELAILQELDE